MKKYRHLIFDWDGTMTNTQLVVNQVLEKVFDEFKISPLLTEKLSNSRNDYRSILQEAAHQDLELAQKMQLSYIKHYFANQSTPPLHQGLCDALVKLKHKMYIITIATGASTPTLKKGLAHHEIEHLIDDFRTVDTCPSKPNPTMLVELINATHTTPSETLLIGDSPSDLLAAQYATIDGMVAGYGLFDLQEFANIPNVGVLNNPSELVEFLDKLPSHF